MRKLVLEIEEGKSAAVSSGQLVVTFPYYNTTLGRYEITGTTTNKFLPLEEGEVGPKGIGEGSITYTLPVK